MMKSWVMGTLLGLALAACQENRIEPQAPKELGSDNLAGGANGSQDAESSADEQVTPPAQITGAYLGGVVLAEKVVNSAAETRVGFVTYYRGKKVADDPTRYTVSFTAAYIGAEPGISVNNPASDVAGYDRLIVLSGSTSKGIVKAYDSTMIYLTIVDMVDHSSDTIQQSVSSVLSSTTPLSSSSTSTSTSTATAGGAGADGRSGGRP